MNKRLLLVVNSDWFFLSHRLALALEAQLNGYDVYILTKDTGKRTIIEGYGLNYIEVPFERSGTNPIKDFRVVMELLRIYRELKPHIVHHVTIKPALYGTLAARLSGLKQLKVVNAISGLGYAFIDNRIRISSIAIKLLMKAVFANRQSNFIFQNPDDLKLYDSLGFLNETNHTLIKGAGVDENSFCYTLPVAKKILRVIFSGRMLSDKGVHEFITAAKYLEAKWKGKAEFVLVGGIDKHNPAGVDESILVGQQISGYLTWIGHQEDMKQACIDADIVTLPSYREGLPKALAEAMAVGRPIVTTDVAGCRECVDEGVNGYLVPVKDAVKLADAIHELLADEQLRLKMGKASRHKFERELALSIVLKQTFDFYQKCNYYKS